MCSNVDNSYNPFMAEIKNGDDLKSNKYADSESALPHLRHLTIAGKCVKCKSAEPEVSIRSSTYCKNCFLNNVDLKYRTALSKSYKTISTTSPSSSLPVCVVGISGGPASRLLLHLLHENHSVSSGKGRKFSRIIVVHIDESTLSNNPFSHESELDYLVNMCNRYGVECAFLKLESVFIDIQLRDDNGPAVTQSSNQMLYIEKKSRTDISFKVCDANCQRDFGECGSLNPSDAFHSILRGCFESGQTLKQDFVYHCKMNALADYAKSKGASCVLLGDNATRQAVKTFSSVAKGRGSSIPYELGNDPYMNALGINLIYPLRDLSDKECRIFCGFKNLEIFDKEVVSLGKDKNTPVVAAGKGKLSIDKLTEKFLTGLDVEYQMTISTLNRTASKLHARKEYDGRFCVFCRHAITYESLSQFAKFTVSRAEELQSVCENKNSDQLSNDLFAGADGILCYGCFENFSTDLSNGRYRLPDFSLKAYMARFEKDGVGQ